MKVNSLVRDHLFLFLVVRLLDERGDRDVPRLDVDLLLDLVDVVEVLAVEGHLFQDLLHADDVLLFELHNQLEMLDVVTHQLNRDNKGRGQVEVALLDLVETVVLLLDHVLTILQLCIYKLNLGVTEADFHLSVRLLQLDFESQLSWVNVLIDLGLWLE